jgi:secreted Zn-dependent insulinase-like peptidase
MTIRVSGFNDKTRALMEYVLSMMTNTSNYLVMSSFDRIVEALDKQYSNESLESSTAGRINRLLALKPSRYSSKSKREILKNHAIISLQALESYCHDFFTNMVVDILCQGNISADESLLLKDAIEKLQSKFMRSKDNNNSIVVKVPSQNIVKLPSYPKVIVLNIIPDNAKEKNVAVELYYQLGPYDLISNTQLDILEQLLSEPFFDSLRTKQQVCTLLKI